MTSYADFFIFTGPVGLSLSYVRGTELVRNWASCMTLAWGSFRLSARIIMESLATLLALSICPRPWLWYESPSMHRTPCFLHKFWTALLGHRFVPMSVRISFGAPNVAK